MEVRFKTDDVKIHLAGAGSGKTEAAMGEIVEALETYRPDEIAFVTYTRKGVETGIERALKVNRSFTPDDLKHFKTLHAICFREAGLGAKNIITRKDIRAFNEAFGFHLTGSEMFSSCSEDDKLLQRYDAVRSQATSGIFLERAYDVQRYSRLINAYEAFKKGHNLVDFYDCLERYLEVGKPLAGVKVFVCDECQDITPLQWKCIMRLSENAVKVRCLGDDYQSVYTHAGADPALLVEMSEHYPVVKHEVSYRIPKAVYRLAHRVTQMLSEKVDKDYRPFKDKEGFVERCPDRTVLVHKVKNDLKAHGYRPGRWMFLFRTNCFIDSMVELLESMGVPYSTSRGFCIEKKELDLIDRYYKFRKVGYGTKKAKDEFMLKYNIQSFDDSFTESGLIPSSRRYYMQEMVDLWGLQTLKDMARGEPWLLLSTIHRVKGGEADYTALFLDATRMVADNVLMSVDEELRILYVGITRCREGLYIVPSRSKYGLDKLLDAALESE
ncbi:MAG: ATP-dependent helicase [Clostridiales bacterium]|nr:ATP-dependent helicase [Clostridiales bacterium]